MNMRAEMEENLYYDYLDTPIGTLFLAANDAGLRCVSFLQCGKTKEELDGPWIYSSSRLADARRQLQEYFRGERKEFSLPLACVGTSFQCDVWRALRKIPYGKTVTYGELATLVHKPQAGRAVGQANGKNPMVIIQPCHRVVGADQQLGGFSSGLFRKRFLLGLEKGLRMLF